MKSQGLLSLLTFSEKRRDILLLLLEKPCNLATIRKKFQVTSPEIAPRIREMEEANMIYKDHATKMYTLTPTGKIVVNAFRPFMDMIELIEKNEDFWNDHDLSGIPAYLLERLADLKDCEFYIDKLDNIYDSHWSYDQLAKSSIIKGVTSIYMPTHPSIIMQALENKAPVYLIVTNNVYKKLQKDCSDDLKTYLNSANTELYLLESVKIAFVVTNSFFSLSLFFKSGNYDPRVDLVCHDEKGIKWGNDLFQYYVSKAEKVKL